MLTVYTHCIHGHDHTLNQHITTALQPSAASAAAGHTGSAHPSCARHAPGSDREMDAAAPPAGVAAADPE